MFWVWSDWEDIGAGAAGSSEAGRDKEDSFAVGDATSRTFGQARQTEPGALSCQSRPQRQAPLHRKGKGKGKPEPARVSPTPVLAVF